MEKDDSDYIDGDKERGPGLLRRIVTHYSIRAQRKMVEGQLLEALTRNHPSELPDVLARASFIRHQIKNRLLQKVLDDPSTIPDVVHQLQESDTKRKENDKEVRRKKEKKKKGKG
ncbi:hypothetical protein KKF55_01220 [Patescibacteria group bacterium]|nr:hypothetical protein [Patescibacteria group bacterium]